MMDPLFQDITDDWMDKVKIANQIVREAYPDKVMLDRPKIISEEEWFNLKMIERYGRHWRRDQDQEED